MAEFQSTEYKAAYVDEPAQRLEAHAADGKLRLSRWTYTHAGGAGQHSVRMAKLPAGRVIVYPDLSRLVTSQFGTSAVMDLGLDAYVGEDGATVSADLDALGNDYAVGAGAVDSALSAPANGAKGLEIKSLTGVDVVATVSAGNIEDGDTVDLLLAYAVVG